MLNNTFTREVTNSVVNSFTGDFIQFESTLQSLSGPHPRPHLIFGGDMGGTCPFGLAPPMCYPGPRWSTNGEYSGSWLYIQLLIHTRLMQILYSIFTMRFVLLSISSKNGNVHVVIDKVWYDWQHKDPMNKNAFGGGSISWQVNSSLLLSEYPAGGPPWLNVRDNS